MWQLCRTSSLALTSIVLAACGGGGSDPPGPSVSASVASISVTKTVAELAAPVTFRVSALNTSATVLYAGVEVSGSAVASADWVNPSDLTADVTVAFPVPADLVPQRHTGTVRFHLCLDEQCNQPLQGSPLSISVDLTVLAVAPISVTANPAQIAVSAMRGVGEPGPQASLALTFSAPVPSTATVSVANVPMVTGTTVAVTSPTAINASVQLESPDAFTAGTYNAAVSLNVCYSAPCVNSVLAAPLSVPITYTVKATGPRPESGVSPLVPTWVISLPHNVVDAEYSDALEAVVMVASYPANALYIYDVSRNTERQVALAKAPTAVSVGPDGVHAAVGHDALITYVDLAATGAAPPKMLNVATVVYDVILDGHGYVHAFPLTDQWVNMHSVRIATNVESIGTGLFYDSEHARLHPSGDYIYGANNGLSPSDIEKFDIRTVPTTRLYDSPYHGDYGMCGDLWFNDGGTNIFTACGNAFRTSTVQASDMVYAGSLTLSQSQYYGFIVRSLSQSEARKEIALIEEDQYFCRSIADPLRCFSHLVLYESDFLNRTALYSFGPLKVAGNDYAQFASFIFHSTNGVRKFAISRLHGMPNPAAEYYLSEL